MRILEFNPKTFPNDLRILREDAGLTQIQLGNRCSTCAGGAIAHYEQGKCYPRIDSLIEIAKILKIDEVRIDTSVRVPKRRRQG